MNQATVITNETVENCLEQANQLRQEGKLDQAIEVYQHAIELDPNSYQSYHYLGETLAQKNDLEAAANFYNLALEINPDFFWSYHCLGLVLFWQGKYDEAISSARKAIKIEPNKAIFHYQLGLYLEQKLELNSAISAYSKALELEPNLTDACHHLEAALAKQAASPEDLEKSNLTEKKSREDINLKTLLSQGRDLIDQEEIDKAITVYQQGIALDANSYKCHHFLGEAFAQKNELEKAENCYRKAININPDYCWSYHNLGQVLLWQCKLDEAIAASRQAIRLAPNNTAFQEQLNTAISNKSANHSVIRLSKKSQDLSDETTQNVHLPNQVVEVIQNKDVDNKRKEIEREIDTYRKSIKLELEPDFTAHHNLYGKLAKNLQKLGELFLDEALHYYNVAINHDSNNLDNYYKSLKLNPDQPTLYFNLANLLRKQGKSGADVFYQMAIQLEPSNARAYIGLADFYLNNQCKEEGIELLVRANRLNTDLVESYLCQLFVKI